MIELYKKDCSNSSRQCSTRKRPPTKRVRTPAAEDRKRKYLMKSLAVGLVSTETVRSSVKLIGAIELRQSQQKEGIVMLCTKAKASPILRLRACSLPNFFVFLFVFCCCCFWLMIDYTALFSALEQARWARIWFFLYERLAFYSSASSFSEYPPKWSTYSAGMAGATWNCSRLSASSLYTVQPCYVSLHSKQHT